MVSNATGADFSRATLHKTVFLTVKGSRASFRDARADKMVFVKDSVFEGADFNNAVLATPSRPDGDTDGYNDCSYATTCAAPSSS